MKMHRHILKGCQSRPLGSYLKALAVLRLVSEQADKSARGHWTEESFVLHSQLDRDQLLNFFLREYSPTPWLSPWNKGSGFFSNADKGLSPIENSVAPRFEKFRRGIAEARAVAKAMDLAVQKENAIKGEAKAIKNKKERELYTNEEGYKKRLSAAERERKRAKDKLQRNCQQQWRGGALEWFRSATVLADDNSPSFPAILGTGGNEGRLDYTNNAYQRLNELYCLEEKDAPPRSGVAESLDHCLFNQTSQSLKKTPIGQFSPAAAGGANASSGPLGASLVNPWELVFILEGSLLFRSSVSRRLTSRQMPQASAPFAVRSQGNGYASSAASDESSRGEQWVPLWEQPATLKEVTALLSEGRVQVKSRTATSSIDMARALSRLGVTRGLSSFERYAFMERNGQSNFAIPLGRWKVDPNPRSFLLDDLDRGSWLDKIRRSSRDEGAPGSFSVCTGRLLDSIFSVLRHPGEPARWQNVLIAMAQTEAQLVLSAQFTGKKRLAPIPMLSKGWIAASDDGSAEFRLALTLASSAKDWTRTRAAQPVRRHWLPLDDSCRQFKVSGESLIKDPRVVMTGRDPGADLAALLQRRLIEAESGAQRQLSLSPCVGYYAQTDDLAQFLSGALDLHRIMHLARAFAALDWHSLSKSEERPRALYAPLDLPWMALRLTQLPYELEGRRIPVDPQVLRLLLSGQSQFAFEIVNRRLLGVGIKVPFSKVFLSPEQSRLYALSMAFQVPYSSAQFFKKQLSSPNQ